MQTAGYTIKIKLTQDEFYCLLKSVFVPKTYLLAQQGDSIKFINFNINNMPDLLKTGRIFNADYEIRYEKLDDENYGIMVFSEQKEKIKKLNLLDKLEKYDLSEEDDNIFLWGKAKQKNGKWIFVETQIPQILEYPEIEGLTDGKELVIKAINYKKDELPCFTRFKGVEVYVPKSN